MSWSVSQPPVIFVWFFSCQSMLSTTTAMWISSNYWSRRGSFSVCERQGRRWVNFSHSLKVGVYLIQNNQLTAALHYLQLKPHFVESCRDLARLAQGWDPSDWGGAKPGESIWAFWESCKRLHLWVHPAIFLVFVLTFSHHTILILNTCVFTPRSRYLAWVCSVFNWWHGLTRWDRQSEIHLWESCDCCGASHDQRTDSVGGVQRVWERHSVHSTGLCFHQ